MSDSRVRDLERRWKETSSPADEAAHLLERVRVGNLTQERLELAADCGHEAAILALGRRPDRYQASLDELAASLMAVGTEACVRAGLALARKGLPAWTTQTDDRRPQELLAACDAWIADPLLVEGVRVADEAVGQALVDWTQAPDSRWSLTDERQVAVLSVSLLKQASFFILREEENPNLTVNVRHMLELAGSAFGMMFSQNQTGLVPSRAGNTSWSTALLVLSEALVPWLLGRSSSASPA